MTAYHDCYHSQWSLHCSLQQTSISCAPSIGERKCDGESGVSAQCVSEPCPDQDRCVVCVRVSIRARVCANVCVQRVCVCACVSVLVFMCLLVEAVVGVAGAGSCDFIRTRSSCFCSSEIKWNFCGNHNQEEAAPRPWCDDNSYLASHTMCSLVCCSLTRHPSSVDHFQYHAL